MRARVGGGDDESTRFLPIACLNEQAAAEFLEEMRWADSPACPRCADTDVYQTRDRKTGDRNRRFLWRCRGCSMQFTVRIGTILEDSPIALHHWCFALWQATVARSGVTARQLQRQTGLSYKSALLAMHRIRYATAPNDNRRQLSRTPEQVSSTSNRSTCCTDYSSLHHGMSRKKPGPTPARLKLQGDWRTVAGEALKTRRPPGCWSAVGDSPSDDVDSIRPN